MKPELIKGSLKSGKRGGKTQESGVGARAKGLKFESTEGIAEPPKANPTAVPLPLGNQDSAEVKENGSSSKQSTLDFKSFKVHKDRITAIIFNPEDQNLITGSSAGELCVFDQNGTVGSRKTDLRGEVTQLKFVERTNAFFANSYSVKKTDNKARNQHAFGAFGKVMDERAYEKNETVLLTPRIKKIKKEKLKRIGIAEFFNAFADRSTGESSTQQFSSESSAQGVLERLQQELEKERKISSRLLRVCKELDQFKP